MKKTEVFEALKAVRMKLKNSSQHLDKLGSHLETLYGDHDAFISGDTVADECTKAIAAAAAHEEVHDEIDTLLDGLEDDFPQIQSDVQEIADSLAAQVSELGGVISTTSDFHPDDGPIASNAFDELTKILQSVSREAGDLDLKMNMLIVKT